jgi:hypothetical protein
MKKIYSFMAMTAFSLGAVAQVDLSVQFVTIDPGEVIEISPVDASFVITNEGADIPAGDTIFISYLINDLIHSMDLSTDFLNYYVIDFEGFPTGAEIIISNEELDWLEADVDWLAFGPEIEFCCAAYGVGYAAVDITFPLDDNPEDNNGCFVFALPEEPSSITSEELELGNVYIAAGQLMIVNNGIGAGAQANINIVNMNGQVAQNETITLAAGTSTVEVSSLATGIYVVSIQVNGAVINRKISIQ